MSGNDFENFIRQQKEKLAKEKANLQLVEDNIGNLSRGGERKKWDKYPSQQPVVAQRREPEETGLFLGSIQDKHKLREERQQEYKEMMEKKYGDSSSGIEDRNEAKSTWQAASSQGTYQATLLLGSHETRRQQLSKERHQDYLNYIKEKQGAEDGHKENIPPSSRISTKEEDTGGLFGGIGIYDKRRQKLQEERQREYKELQAQKNVRSRGQVDTNASDYVASLPGYKDSPPKPEEESNKTLPGVHDRRSAELNKVKERNREYNDFLRQQEDRRSKSRSQVRDYHRDRGGKERERGSALSDDEDDFRQYLQEREPRRGWATPTMPSYEEILDRKRMEERQYRRNDDPELYEHRGGPSRMRLGDTSYMRSSMSDGQLNKAFDEDERRFRELDREFEAKRVRFESDRNRRKPRSGDYYERERQTRFQDLDVDDYLDRKHDRHGSYPPRVDHYDRDLDRDRAPDRGRSPDKVRPTDSTPQRRQSPPTSHQPGLFNATLMIGQEPRGSADMRRKEAYRKELERQMQETKTSKLRAKQEAGVMSHPTMDIGRRAAPLAREPSPPRRREPSSPVHAPQRGHNVYPGQPSFRNGGGLMGGPMMYGFPASDESYHFWNNRNLLDPNINPGLGLNALDTSGLPPPRLEPPQESTAARQPEVVLSRPTPRDDRPAGGGGVGGAGAGYNFGSGGNKDEQREKQRQYQEELKQQIEEVKRMKQKEKEERENYERKKEEEIRNYDPFGRGGGGAPVRDQFGNPVTDLRKMKQTNDGGILEKYLSPREPDHTPTQLTQPQSVPSSGNDVAADNASFARGGHGIFGDPISTEQKNTKLRYQDELRIQIEEKKKQAEEEKTKQKLEDERMLKKIQEDQAKMLAELEEEKAKERRKQEEALRQQEELRRQQEERRKEEDRKRKEEDERQQEELRKKQEEERLKRQREQDAVAAPASNGYRSNSPVIPTLAKAKPASPPIRSQNTLSRPSSRAPSADVLRQLAQMRQQLKSERDRVESDLDKEKHTPSVGDRRVPSQQKSARDNVDVFEIARKKGPVSVRRPDASPNPGQAQEFTNLKNRSSSAARQAMRNDYPHTPVTNDALEAQQMALIKQQERQLQKLKEESPLEQEMGGMNPKDLGLLRRESSTISANQLDSESAFIDVDDNLLDIGHRNSSARSRRRAGGQGRALATPQGQDPMGSVASLNPDDINRKNEARLQKLKRLAGEDTNSTADPDDILERFMQTQKHNRPPSGKTLKDESWLDA